MFPGGLLVNQEDVIAAAIAAALVILLSLFFQKTTTGRACAPWPTTTRLPSRGHSTQPHLGDRGAWPVSWPWWQE